MKSVGENIADTVVCGMDYANEVPAYGPVSLYVSHKVYGQFIIGVTPVRTTLEQTLTELKDD